MLEQIKNILKKHGQEHLLDFIENLKAVEREDFLDQLESIDFKLMEDLYIGTGHQNDVQHSMERNIAPIRSDVLKSFQQTRIKELYDKGSRVLAEGSIAVVTMAGGQGTRLGHNGPKGTYQLGEPICKTLFQLQAEKLLKLREGSGQVIPWYIMTSEENHIDTIMHFEGDHYFGYPRGDIFFFKQGTLPLLDLDGKILLREKGEIYLGPDGNGGVFQSLKKSHALLDMKSRGVEWVFFTGIDNALVKMADPLLLGYTIESGKSASSKSSLKTHPGEKAGVFCKEDGKTTIMEYSEIPAELLEMTDDKGDLLYGDINILVHLFQLSDLQRIADVGLPYHKAVKKVSYMVGNGQKIEANALKYESFIFDAFKLLDDVAILRVEREQEFAPIKNRAGEDSPESALRLLTLLTEHK